MTTPASLCRFAVLSLAMLALAGCSSDGGPGERGASPGPRRKPPTPMAGHESFFDGQILAEVNVGTEGLPHVAPGDGGGNGGGGGSGGRHGGGGGNGRLNIAGAGGAVGGNISGDVPFGGGRHGGSGGYGEGGEGGGAPAPRPMVRSYGQPVMIHLRFTNQGATTVTLVIDDFVSALGNFAVRPEKLVLEPGHALETEPMTSQLAGELSETDAILVLRVGPKAEKKTFTLHAVIPPAPETPAVPPAK